MNSILQLSYHERHLWSQSLTLVHAVFIGAFHIYMYYISYIIHWLVNKVFKNIKNNNNNCSNWLDSQISAALYGWKSKKWIQHEYGKITPFSLWFFHENWFVCLLTYTHIWPYYKKRKIYVFSQNLIARDKLLSTYYRCNFLWHN